MSEKFDFDKALASFKEEWNKVSLEEKKELKDKVLKALNIKEYAPLCPSIYKKLLAEQERGNIFLQPSEPHPILGLVFNPVEYMEKKGYYPSYSNLDIDFETLPLSIVAYHNYGGFSDYIEVKENKPLEVIIEKIEEKKLIFNILIWSTLAASEWRSTVEDLQSIYEIEGFSILSSEMPLVVFQNSYLHVLEQYNKDLSQRIRKQIEDQKWEAKGCNTVLFEFVLNEK